MTAPREILRVATSGDYAPFSRWPSDDLQPSGFSVAIAIAYAEDRGVDLRWSRFRWPDLATDLEAGSFDLALSGITVRPDRSTVGRFSLPLTTSGAVALVHEESRFGSPADLDQVSTTLAVNAGGHLERVARRLFPAATIQPIAQNGNVLGELIQGRVDAVLTDSLEAPHWLRTAKTGLRTIGPLTRDRKAGWFPVEDTEEADRFNRWLLGAEASGRLERIRSQYGLPTGRTASPLSALLSSLDERLSLMPAVADAKKVLQLPIENLDREELVLEAAGRGILRSADEAGVEAPDASAIRRLFRSQIEAAKWIQTRRRGALESVAGESTPMAEKVARAELEEIIRPSLIYLGDRISMLLVASVESSPRHLTFDDVSTALERHHLPDDHLRAIYDALSEIIQTEGEASP